MANRHDWLSWDQYVSAYERNLDRFPHFIRSVDLEPIVTHDAVFWSGRILCQDGIEIAVTKSMTVRRRRGRAEVRTEKYSYHVLSREPNGDVLSLFRYDNAHAHPNHPDAHHRHEPGPDGRMRVVHVGKDLWPTLGDVIEEAESWWIDRAANP